MKINLLDILAEIQNENEKKIVSIISTLNKTIREKNQEISEKEQLIKHMQSSKFWKMRNLFVEIRNFLKL
jgi:hypothetical protein